MRIVKIAIDPGHGHSQKHGAPVEAGLSESAVVLSLALKIEQYLARLPRVEPRLTRWAPVGESYKDRAERLKAWDPDLVVCLHCDASSDPAVKGSFALARHDDGLGAACARAMLTAMPGVLLPVKLNPFHAFSAEQKQEWTNRAWNVLHCFDPWPSFLIELGRLTNEEDRHHLTHGEWDDFISHAVSCAAMRRLEQIVGGRS